MPWMFFMESMEYGGEKGRGREWVGWRKKEREEKEKEGGEGGRSTTILSIVAEGSSKKSSMPDVTIS